MLLKLLQGSLDGLSALLKTIVGILPHSPFVGFYNLSIENDYLGMLAWVVPINEMIATCEAWLVAIGFFYLYMIVLRWAKAIE